MPETIKEMHKIYWFDDVKYGLGFRILDFDNETWVGHGGSCPGYRSQLIINPDKKIAYSVMINSSGTSPTKFVKGIHEILSKVETLSGGEINRFCDRHSTDLTKDSGTTIHPKRQPVIEKYFEKELIT